MARMLFPFLNKPYFKQRNQKQNKYPRSPELPHFRPPPPSFSKIYLSTSIYTIYCISKESTSFVRYSIWNFLLLHACLGNYISIIWAGLILPCVTEYCDLLVYRLHRLNLVPVANWYFQPHPHKILNWMLKFIRVYWKTLFFITVNIN